MYAGIVAIVAISLVLLWLLDRDRTPFATRMSDAAAACSRFRRITIGGVLAAYELLARSHVLYAGVVPPLA